MFGFRSDGKRAKDMDPILRFTSHIMPHRYDAQVMYLCEARCEKMDEYIKEKEAEGIKITYMHILFASIIRMYAERPMMNRFIMNGRVYNRNEISICYTVKKALRDGADETTVKLEFNGTENLFEIKKAIDDSIVANKGSDKKNGTDKTAKLLMSIPNIFIKMAIGLIKWSDKHGMLPKKLIKISPFHASCFVTNMKSISTEYVYHHIYDFGTVSLFVSLGKEHSQPVVDEEGNLSVGKIVQLGTVIDERIVDGLYNAKSIKVVKKYMENPRLLEVGFNKEKDKKTEDDDE